MSRTHAPILVCFADGIDEGRGDECTVLTVYQSLYRLELSGDSHGPFSPTARPRRSERPDKDELCGVEVRVKKLQGGNVST